MTCCLIYARYSSDQQREASIDDQIRVCRARAAREGWHVAAVFQDAAIFGATQLRPGFQGLLAAIRAGQAGIVLAESLDRISRDQEHIARFHKDANFAGVRIVTLAEGEISELHVGLKGTMGALFLKDLADKTRRGMEGRIRQGRAPGRVVYGYRAVRRLDAAGEPERGLREPDPIEAAIVQRIFRDYAAGHSPRRIAKALNAEGVAGPNGGRWHEAVIRGRPGCGDGLLRNRIYVGQLVWNRTRGVKDPTTGRVVRRQNRPEALVVQDAPAFRLVEDALWEAVQARLDSEAAPRAGGSDTPAEPRFWERRRARHLLTGKVVCGVCGSPFGAIGRDYLACKGVRQGYCSNKGYLRRPRLEAQVLDGLKGRLMAPELVSAFVAEFTAEWNRLAAEAGACQTERWRELQTVERKIGNLVEVIEEGRRSPELLARLDELEARRAELRARLAGTPPSVPALHPNLAKVYRQRVARLQQALSAGDAPDALEAARALIDRVVVWPPDDGGGQGLELVGELAAMLREAGMGGGPGDEAADVVQAFVGSVKEGVGAPSPPGGARGSASHFLQ